MDKRKLKQLLILVLIFIVLLGGGIFTFKYLTRIPIPPDAISVREVLEEQQFDQSVKVYGKVSSLGDLGKPAFELNSDNATMHVWYALMAEDDGAPRPEVNIGGIQNEDWVIVEGELKDEGKFHDGNIIWASSIEKAETKHNRTFFASFEDCQKECAQMGYKTGNCLPKKKAKDSYIKIDDCLVPSSQECKEQNTCNCYCYNNL